MAKQKIKQDLVEKITCEAISIAGFVGVIGTVFLRGYMVLIRNAPFDEAAFGSGIAYIIIAAGGGKGASALGTAIKDKMSKK